VVEAAATVIKENQVIQDTSGGGCRWVVAWFLVATLVVVVCLAKRIEI